MPIYESKRNTMDGHELIGAPINMLDQILLIFFAVGKYTQIPKANMSKPNLYKSGHWRYGKKPLVQSIPM